MAPAVASGEEEKNAGYDFHQELSPPALVSSKEHRLWELPRVVTPAAFVLRSLRYYRRAQSQGYHTTDCLEERCRKRKH